MIESVLSLDLGITTGWAVFRDRELHNYGTITNHYRDLPILLVDETPALVVAEKPLIVGNGKLAKDLQQVIALAEFNLCGGARDIIWVAPGEWKPTPAAKEQVPKGLSQHERDAIRIGYWAFRYRLQGAQGT